MHTVATLFERWEWFTKHAPGLGFIAEMVALVVGGWIIQHLILGSLSRWAERTEATFDDKLVAVVRAALRPLLILAGVAIAVNSLPIPAHLLSMVNRLLTLAALGTAIYCGYRTVMILSTAWLSDSHERQELVDPATFFIRVLFAGFAVTILLDNLGVSLTAVWTSLGVGSVAIALALQDTLSNFFSGVYLRLDRPIRVGDYIKLESGEEGFVDTQGWRSTRIKTLPNNIVVVPNSKLASAIVTNYSMPETPMSLLVSIGVSYEADPDQVESILIEEASRAAGEVPGLMSDPAPFVRFIPGFGDSSLNFTLICRVATFVDQYLAQHELRKRILARFRAEGISIPFPQRDVHVYNHPNSEQA
jgi:small-conductance mechanosensitive channel